MSVSGPRDTKAAGSGSRDIATFPVVGIGASAGGLEPCKKLFGALSAPSGMAFILVQHLDPTHDTMMVELLADQTPLAVRLAQNGMRIECEHLYVIPPGRYLSVADGALRLSEPTERHGTRLPFDFLLHSLAQAFGRRAVCVILSGGGADGSLGLATIRDRGGLVIVQDPEEAAHDGMPRSAIGTGKVDTVLRVAEIPMALAGYDRRMRLSGSDGTGAAKDHFADIIDMLRATTGQDFSLYKKGTLERRIERRMAMASVKAGDFAHYRDTLRSDPKELDLLAKDMLIHVTRFFRNPETFEVLSTTIIPGLIRDLIPERPLRVWIAGCSTGEETYSLAMLFREQVAAASGSIHLQIFASDVDADAIAQARAGFYPASIEADVSAARLARFFAKEGDGYRVLTDLRASVIFTVQDVLVDPPFSRIDMVSCRNLLIYLGPEAQRKVIALFHFAIRDGGILLLGNAETVGPSDGFEVIGQHERLYRHAGRKRAAPVAVPASRAIEGLKGPLRPSVGLAPSRQAILADLCRTSLLDSFAPAAVLTDDKNDCLYLFGRTDDYLQAAPGHAVHDVLAMARDGVRTKLRSAIQKARRAQGRATATGGTMVRDGAARAFTIVVQPVRSGADALMLICFIEEPKPGRRRDRPVEPQESRRTAELEHELDGLRGELEAAIRSHEAFGEEQKAVNEETLSVNEEYQSTNEELISSKEELQSLNEELSALNGQLQETLERQRTTANDLQNVLYSTDVATLFLDVDLRIRFFTPAVRALFSLMPGDIGRLLSNFNSLATDTLLPADARTVLHSLTSIEREIEARDGIWFSRRIMPYRTHGDAVEGVVITFTDITHRKRAAKALEEAKREAERANAAKSRFLAAASHDLRQPLQTLTLLQSLLVKTLERRPLGGTSPSDEPSLSVQKVRASDRTQKSATFVSDALAGAEARGLIARSEEALSAMSGMLNTLLDINQIEAGTIKADVVDVPIAALLETLREEFGYHAKAQGLVLRVVPCSLSIRTDPQLIEQMIRNLLSNALKYTRHGKVLLGCRRRKGALSIEIWDTGIGIPGEALQTIFEEYHQLDNAPRDRSLGLGLGLSIVRRLGDLLGHRVHVRSQEGKGSVFAIEATLATAKSLGPEKDRGVKAPIGKDRRFGTVLIIEDDVAVRDLLKLYLEADGHVASTARDGAEAMALAAQGAIRPDIILSDYALPGGMDGLAVAVRLRKTLRYHVPVVILTADISTDTLSAIAKADCVQLNKPVKPQDLSRTLLGLLSAQQPIIPRHASRRTGPAVPDAKTPVVFIIDDDKSVRDAIRSALEDDGRAVEDYASCETFLEAFRPGPTACILIDAYLPGMPGIELLETLRIAGGRVPAIMITGHSDVQMAVRAMKAGASDFIEKPIGRLELLASVTNALEQGQDTGELFARRDAAAAQVAGLTGRQRQIMALVLAGHPSKNIAADLGISQRTVENHRATIMRKTGSKSLPALARLSFSADWTEGGKAP